MHGEPSRDRAALVDVTHRYSIMASDLGDVIVEADAKMMPVYVEDKGCRTVDSRYFLKKK